MGSLEGAPLTHGCELIVNNLFLFKLIRTFLIRSDSPVIGPSAKGNFFMVFCKNLVKTSEMAATVTTSSPQRARFAAGSYDYFFVKHI